MSLMIHKYIILLAKQTLSKKCVYKYEMANIDLKDLQDDEIVKLHKESSDIFWSLEQEVTKRGLNG